MPGDLPPDELRAALHRAADLVVDYLERVGEYPVLPPVSPGDVGRALPAAPPEEPEPLDLLLDDYRRLIEPNVTHWNHPGFLAYFAISGSGPGILGELLAAGLNVNAMLWRTSPAAVELEERVCDWLRQMIGLPPGFRGHINDTASSSSLVALAAARHGMQGLEVRTKGLAGRDLPALTVYASDQAHSSIDKACIVLGIGQENVRRVATDAEFRMSVPALEEAIARDRAAGKLPMAVVATAGTTSTTSVDPVEAIADLCAREGIWLHVDAAYAGSAAICPEYRALMPGIERGDSIVVNPHKWLFTPVDCSILWVKDPALLRAAFSLIPDYLRTDEAGVTNLMDLGFQLGRRFRALKLWMVIRGFGVEGLRERIREHCAIARELAARIESDPGFELAAPVPFSAVCFRAVVAGSPEDQDRFNERLLARVNAAGPFFLSPTTLHGRLTPRIAIGNIRTTREHIEALWDLLVRSAAELRP
ncbi:MAG TPA: aminotransferase class I/II-fold pyridoxal phosphate-dependent enzyme [Thermoanaerobaculia bacterium]|nr:aminotransferase class I/II-fold pyridoxal phosphate-dependent enzyme [Thermoanaerobaculia bacterium]